MLRRGADQVCLGTIAVRRTLQRLTGQGLIFTDPKSQKSRRQIVIPPALSGILREHRKAQRELKLLYGPAYREHDLVFPRPDGSPEASRRWPPGLG